MRVMGCPDVRRKSGADCNTKARRCLPRTRASGQPRKDGCQHPNQGHLSEPHAACLTPDCAARVTSRVAGRIYARGVGTGLFLYYPALSHGEPASTPVKPKTALRSCAPKVGYGSPACRSVSWAAGGSLFALVWYGSIISIGQGRCVANSLRAVFGDDNVAKLEDFVYGAEDRVNRLLKKNEPPKAYWQVPGPLRPGRRRSAERSRGQHAAPSAAPVRNDAAQRQRGRGISPR